MPEPDTPSNSSTVGVSGSGTATGSRSNAGTNAGGGAGGGGNNSSDFVRKLFKMLEEPQYANVVRWGNEGKTFIVHETEEFTKNILPKHFKHNNWSSFVRQLNKYDFHKVKHTDETGASPHGPDASEFFHAEFHRDGKENLDNIRRKAPAARKQQSQDDNFPAAQQLIEGFNSELRAMRHEMHKSQEDNNRITRLLADQVGRLRKIVTRQSQALDEIVQWSVETLSVVQADETRIIPDPALSSRVKQTQEIVESLFKDISNDIEKLNPIYEKGLDPALEGGASPASISDTNGTTDMFSMVPFGGMNTMNPRRGSLAPGVEQSRVGNPKKKDLWGERKPWVLLVEDEAIAAKIAQKRLQYFGCKYDYARTGKEAVAKVNEDPQKWDCILMDIKLPEITGIHATALIRMESIPRMPVIAMTASRQPDDLKTYLKHGMDDLLAKPFSNQVFEAMLRKHLPHLLHTPDPQVNLNPSSRSSMRTYRRVPPPSQPSASQPRQQQQNHMAAINTNIQQQKFEPTPQQQLPSPATTMAWHNSPAGTAHMQGASPVTTSGMVPTSATHAPVMHQPSITGLPPNLPPGLNNPMPGMQTPGQMTNTQMMQTLSGVGDPSISMGAAPYMTAMANSHLGLGPPGHHRNQFAAMGTGFNPMVESGGHTLDFADDRPEKRQRMYDPGDMQNYG